MKMKCIIILSSKCSGSSALQYFLAKIPGVSYLSKTKHFEQETLYWYKAACLLKGPEMKRIFGKGFPGKESARHELVEILCDNLDSYIPPESDEELVFGGWKLLCEKYSPVFLEKTPHHLTVFPSLELIAECMKRFPEIEFLIIGLVRNPMDTVYSMWTRWRKLPEKSQYRWVNSYSNLLKFKQIAGDRLVIVRYKDIIKDASCLKEVYDFIGVSSGYDGSRHFHAKSLGKWRKDKFFGFKLDEEVVRLAEKFGYSSSELAQNNIRFIWPVYKNVKLRWDSFKAKASSRVKHLLKKRKISDA